MTAAMSTGLNFSWTADRFRSSARGAAVLLRFHFGFLVNGPMVRDSAESLMRTASRLSRVSGRLALMTHQVAVFLYQGGCDWKNVHAGLLFRNCFSWAAVSSTFACSKE